MTTNKKILNFVLLISKVTIVSAYTGSDQV